MLYLQYFQPDWLILMVGQTVKGYAITFIFTSFWIIVSEEFFCTQSYWIWLTFKLFIWSIDEVLTGNTTLDQSGPGSNGNEGVLNAPKIFRIGMSPSDVVSNHSWDSSIRGRVLTHRRKYSQCILSPANMADFQSECET